MKRNVTQEYNPIRPAGRLMLTIGRDLIKSPSSALLELVKNAYDADSPDVSIKLCADRSKNRVCIVIVDHGHGMTTNVVKNVWLVPATGDKLKRKRSPLGRTLQGRKGVGRFATAILGDELLLETVSDKVQTDVMLNWAAFESSEYLDQVKVLISSYEVDSDSGTKLTIEGGADYLEQWSPGQIRHMIYELKKLIPPKIGGISGAKSDFRINIEIVGFGDEDMNGELPPFPLLELFDYRISGFLRANGHGEFIYSCKRLANHQDEKIVREFKPTGCGDIKFDIRVYDRDKEALEQLVGRGLHDSHGRYLKYTEARRLLDTANGIGVYRNGFRISPLGDADYDWLELNKKRVQFPTKCIGSDQAIGYVGIASEEESNLIEKSARDGLRENPAYVNLKRCVAEVILELENRRLKFRRMMGYGRAIQQIGHRLSVAFGFLEFKKTISKRLEEAGTPKEVVDDVLKFVDSKENEQAKFIEDIGETIALYQGQATVGKIINVVLHEGRRPLNYLKNQIPYIKRYHKKYVEKKDAAAYEKIDTLLNGTESNVESFVELFGRLDPLAVSKRRSEKEERLAVIINDSFLVFENELREAGITYAVNCDTKVKIECNRQDMQAVFVNLIDNSIFWIKDKQSLVRKITVDVDFQDGKIFSIDYRDTGPGISKDLIRSEMIFEPNFSTKVGGTGLGLAIAGEAAQRNRLQLSALECEEGAYFRLVPKEFEGDDEK